MIKRIIIDYFQTNLKKNFLKNVFLFPTKKLIIVMLWNKFSKNFKKTEAQEYIIILVTKEEFAILDKINVSELFLRLDELKIQLVYEKYGLFNFKGKNEKYFH